MSGMEPQPSRCDTERAISKPDDWIREALACHEGPLLRYAFSLTQNAETAQDIVQDTFLKLCEQDQRTVAPYLTRWLYTVCRHRAVDILRKSNRTVDLTEEEMNQKPANSPTPSETTEQIDLYARVLLLLENLPHNQREVVRLKFQSQLSYQEIADITQLTPTNVGFLLHTALKSLRQRLELLDRPGKSSAPKMENQLAKAP